MSALDAATAMRTEKGQAAGSANMIDPAALMAIRNLELRARVVVQGFWTGLHRSPYHGFSVEFTEYRQYSPGDDPRFLDWRLYARSDRFYVKKFDYETNVRCHLLVDNSKSMHYTSLSYLKAEYANTLAATFGYFLYRQGDAVGLLTFDEKVREYLPARNRTGHLRHLMLALEKPAEGTGTDLTAPLQRMTQMVRKRGMIVLISDLLAPIERLENDLASLTAAGHDLIVIHVLDPAEVDFNFANAGMFRDVESGRELYIDPLQARTSYQERITKHFQNVQAVCQHLGIAYLRALTNTPLELILFDFLRERMQRGRSKRIKSRSR